MAAEVANTLSSIPTVTIFSVEHYHKKEGWPGKVFTTDNGLYPLLAKVAPVSGLKFHRPLLT